MRIGYMIDLIHRFNGIKRHSYNKETKLGSLDQLISDIEQAFEMPVGDKEAMSEFKENNEFLYNVYLEITNERVETEYAMVTG